MSRLSESLDQYGMPIVEAKLPAESDLEQFYLMANREETEKFWEIDAKEEFEFLDPEEVEERIEGYFNRANWDFEEWKEKLDKMPAKKKKDELFSNFLMAYVYDREESDDSSTVYFENPRVLGKTTLLRFTPADPQEVLKNGFTGRGPERLGLTHHEASTIGELSFAFEKKALKKKEIASMALKYGANLFQFTVPYAVKVYHNTDYEDQVVFDVTTVSDLKFLGRVE